MEGERLLYVVQDWYSVTTEAKKEGRPRADRLTSRPAHSDPPAPSSQSEVNPRVRIALEFSRVRLHMTIRDLSDATKIAADVLRDYESGVQFPKAADIRVLQEVLRTRFVP